jgi:predicted Fe-Mo cluster-binding NifX family protein
MSIRTMAAASERLWSGSSEGNCKGSHLPQRLTTQAWAGARWDKARWDRDLEVGEVEEVPEAEEDGGDRMKVCIPTLGNGGMEEAVSQHFGRSPTFTLVNLDTNEVQILPNKGEHMGGSILPTDTLRDRGVQVMIVGGLGPKAIQAFAEQCIEVFVGATGRVKDAINDWKEGNLVKASSDNACKEHRH